MTTQLLALLLLCLRPGSILPADFLDIVEDLVRFSELKCVLLVLDDPDSLGSIRREVFRKVEVQSKVIYKQDIKQMDRLSVMNKCGIFVKLHKEETISKYLNSVLELNKFDKNIFKTLHWYIFLGREDSLDIVFRFDSNVFLVIEEMEREDFAKLIETYSIEEGETINKIVGRWSSKHGLGNILKVS